MFLWSKLWSVTVLLLFPTTEQRELHIERAEIQIKDSTDHWAIVLSLPANRAIKTWHPVSANCLRITSKPPQHAQPTLCTPWFDPRHGSLPEPNTVSLSSSIQTTVKQLTWANCVCYLLCSPLIWVKAKLLNTVKSPPLFMWTKLSFLWLSGTF